jgi:putative ABC transport system permease protein
VALIIAIDVINASVLDGFRRMIDAIAGPAALEITLGVGEVGFAESTLDVVRASAGVAAAVPLARGTIALADEPSETLQLFGIDLVAEEDLARYPIMTRDRQAVLRGLTEPHSVLLTTEFARAHALGIGDDLRLSTPDGVAAFTVRGLLVAEGVAQALAGRLAVMDLPAAQMLLHKPERLDQIDVVVRADADVDTVRTQLQSVLPEWLRVARPAQRGADYERILSAFQAMLSGLSALCLVAGVFIIYNTTATAAVERASVMASLRVIGADAARLFRVLMAEALILGLVGSAIGFVCGVGLAYLLSGMVSDSMGVIFQLRFPITAYTIPPSHIVLIATLGVGTALFAASFAALQVARLEPLTVLRSGALSAEPRVVPRRLAVLWLVLVGVSALALVAEYQLKSIAWGTFGSTLWNAAVLVIAIPLVHWSADRVSRLLPRMFRSEGRVAAASLFRSPSRTGVTVAAIALVLAIAITVSSLALSFGRSVDRYYEAGGFLAADAVVSSVSTEGGWLETPLPEAIVPEIRKVAGVANAVAWRALTGQMFRGQRIGLLAFDDAFLDPDRYVTAWYVEGDATGAAAALRAGTAVNVSANLADRFDLHPGAPIELTTPTGPLTLVVAGVVRDYLSDGGSVILSRRLLRERWRDELVSRVNVHLEPGTSFETARTALLQQVGATRRLKVLSYREMLDYQRTNIAKAFAFTDAIKLLIAIVTAVGIFDLLLSTILERRRELAVWRLIGASEGAVRRSVIIESVTIGVIGTVLGIAVSIVTAWIWVAVNFPYLVGYRLEYHFAFVAMISAVTLVLVVTGLAGRAAAGQATRRVIVTDLKAD